MSPEVCDFTGVLLVWRGVCARVHVCKQLAFRTVEWRPRLLCVPDFFVVRWAAACGCVNVCGVVGVFDIVCTVSCCVVSSHGVGAWAKQTAAVADCVVQLHAAAARHSHD